MSGNSGTIPGSANHYDESDSLAVVSDFVVDDPSPVDPNSIQEYDYKKTYFHYTRLRYSQRAGFRDDLQHTVKGQRHWEYIKGQEELIRDFRAPTGEEICTTEKDTRFQTLANLRRKWRQTAYDELEKRRKSIEERIQEEKKKNIPITEIKWNKKRIEDARRVLNSVGSPAWKNRLSESEPPEDKVIDPNKYLKGYSIKINKNGGGYQFNRMKSDLTLDSEVQAETPLQTTSKPPCSPHGPKVGTRIESYIPPQGKSRSSSSTEQPKGDVIRYIHLPANNMDWVEVRTICLIFSQSLPESHTFQTAHFASPTQFKTS
jgi:hypothetical protein